MREVASRDLVTNKVTRTEHVIEIGAPTEGGTGGSPEALNEHQGLRSNLVPEGNRLDKVFALLRTLEAGRKLTPKSLDLTTNRWLLYYRHAARILGYLTHSGSLTRLGRRVARMSYADFLQQTSVQFEVSDVGAAWLDWAGASSLAQLEPSQALPFLEANVAGLTGLNINRRASTLRSWLKELWGHQYLAT